MEVWGQEGFSLNQLPGEEEAGPRGVSAAQSSKSRANTPYPLQIEISTGLGFKKGTPCQAWAQAMEGIPHLTILPHGGVRSLPSTPFEPSSASLPSSFLEALTHPHGDTGLCPVGRTYLDLPAVQTRLLLICLKWERREASPLASTPEEAMSGGSSDSGTGTLQQPEGLWGWGLPWSKG